MYILGTEMSRPRSEKRAETRARLLEAAAAIFAEKGFPSATLGEIAERAGYTRGAIYWNFEDKEHLLAALVERQIAQELEADEQLVGPVQTFEELRPMLAARLDDPGFDKMVRTTARLNLELIMHAVRNPDFAPQVAAPGIAIRRARTRMTERIAEASRAPLPKVNMEFMSTVFQAVEMGFAQLIFLEPETIKPRMMGDAFMLLEDALLALGREQAAASKKKTAKRPAKSARRKSDRAAR